MARLMQENAIQSCVSQKFKVVTTDSNHDLPIAPRVFEAENAAETLSVPNQAWAGDITYAPTDEGWLYPLYVQKAERKNRTKAEVNEIIFWLTGCDQAGELAKGKKWVGSRAATHASSDWLSIRLVIALEQPLSL